MDEWQSELLLRKRMAVLIALRDGGAPRDLPNAPASAVANFWEKVGALARAGHIAPSLIAEGFGGVQLWWAILAPYVMNVRTEDVNPSFWEHFEWLAGTLVRIHPASAIDQQWLDRTLEQRIAATEADLRDLEAVRGVTLDVTPTAIPVTRPRAGK